MSATRRVSRGVYRDAACELTVENGQLDKYDLAARVGAKCGRYVSSRGASAWIRRQRRSGILVRVGAAVNGRIAAGGCPASYAVVLVELYDWRRERGAGQ